MLKGLDVLVIDLQDVGSRIYTFIYTMANCLRAGKKHGVPVIVTDRPNPIGGEKIDGPMLVKGFESFVGQFPIPMRHGMTIGELARFFNDACGIGADLTVVPMEHWRRAMHFDETGLPWVMPSPNIPTLETAVVYPGTVLFEGTNVSEGRGTTRPFELIGAPWVDAEGARGEALDVWPARRALPAGRVRADVSEACEAGMRRVSDPCARSRQPFARLRPRLRCSRKFARRTLRSSNGGSRLTNTSTKSCRSTSLPDRASCGSRSKAGCAAERSPRAGREHMNALPRARTAVPAVLRGGVGGSSKDAQS